MAARYPVLPAGRLARGRRRRKPSSPASRRRATRPTGDIRKGFVYKRVPHVTLKSIANNPDIQRGHDPRGDRRRHRPPRRDRDALRPALRGHEARPRHRPVHRREPLARTACCSTADDDLDGRVSRARSGAGSSDFATMILDNLRKAGVQNTRQGRAARSSTASTPIAGTWIHADGRVHRRRRRAAPRRRLDRPRARHRRPGPGQGGRQGGGAGRRLRPADRLRLRLRPARRRGGEAATASSTVLPTRMNPDLAMGDELLKKTGAGNLFMVFGEPDVDDRRSRRTASSSSRSAASTSTTRRPARSAPARPTTSPAGSSTPTTTARASSSATPTSPARDEPYDKLKRALRAEIDEAAWSSLYRTDEPPVPDARDRQDRREGHQPLRRRGAEGLRRPLIPYGRQRSVPAA